MLFGSWTQIAAIALKSGVTYLAVIVALRLFGEQALAQMSGYDLICTIALGSFVANLAFSTNVPLVDGLVAIIAILVLQEALRYLQFHVRGARKLITEEPCIVVWNGELLEDRLASFRIAIEEIRAAVRRAGLASLQEAQAVVLENDGNWSVVKRCDQSDLSAFEGLDVPEQ